MVKLKNAILRFGKVSALSFAPDCVSGDWQSAPVVFPQAFPAPPIVVATGATVPGGETAAAVALTQDVTQTGFTLRARNSACNAGRTRFNWLAILETPSTDQQRREDLRMGVLHPKRFSSDCTTGDWQSWPVRYSQPDLDDPGVVLLTASNLFISEGVMPEPDPGPFTAPWVTNHNAAAVGLVQNPTKTGFTLVARNSDCAIGYCNFNYVAVSIGPVGIVPVGGVEEMIVDTGRVDATFLAPDCAPGDWFFSDVFFTKAFLTPPVVLITGDVSGASDPAAPVCIAQYVTPNGFRLAARNSDCGPGSARFQWVALGCLPGCG